METLAEILLITLSVGLLLYVLIEYITGRTELVSIRNIALGGFVLFQPYSGFIWLILDRHQLQGYPLFDPGGTGMQFAVACTIFITIALFVYSRGWGVKKLAAFVPAPKVVPTETAMWIIAVLFTGLAAVFRFTVAVPYIGILAEMFGISLAGTAAGFAGWLIGKRLLNPFVLFFAVFIILVNLVIAQTGQYGRRTILIVALGAVWGGYYARLRFEKPAKTLTILAIGLVPVALFLALYTSIRGGDNRRVDFVSMVRAMASAGNLAKGLEDLDGQGTGGISMWVIEYFGPGGVRETEPFQTAVYFVMYPLPRAFFPFKGEPLSVRIPDYANLSGVKIGSLTVGPGVVGHSFADGGWHVLILYAVFIGALLRGADEIVRRQPYAPFIVLPMGSTLGEIMGASRGESSAMLFKFLFGTVTAYVFVAATGKVLNAIGYAPAVDPNADPYTNPELDGYGDSEEYRDTDDGYTDWSADDQPLLDQPR